MLRRRHVTFHIDEPARDRWLHHMDVAITALGPPPEVATALREYFALAADAMVNQP